MSGIRARSITDPNGIGSQISQARKSTSRAPSAARFGKSACMAPGHCNGNGVLDFRGVQAWQLEANVRGGSWFLRVTVLLAVLTATSAFAQEGLRDRDRDIDEARAVAADLSNA